MDYHLLTELLPLLGQYQATKPMHDQSMPDFLAWAQTHAAIRVPEMRDDRAMLATELTNMAAPPTATTSQPNPNDPDQANLGEPATNDPITIANRYVTDTHTQYGGMPDAASAIGRLVIVLSRYAKRYSKLAITDSPFTSLDEVTFLASILEKPGMSKMEVILRNTQEKPQGMEVIKRLTAHGLIEITRSEDKKRKQPLHITAEGQQAFFSFIPKLGQIARLVVGNLNQAEQDQLFVLLDKLDAFHHPYYINRQHNTFDELLAHALRNVG